MKQQDYKNHTQFAPKAYYAALLMGLVVLIIAVVILFSSVEKTNSILFLLLSVGLVVIGYFSRALALKAQDRAIRAEENLRYYVMTGNLLDSSLSISQIIALRFASDEELKNLAQEAIDEKLTNRQIKQRIKNWRADYYRV